MYIATIYCKNILHIYWKFKSINQNIKVKCCYDANILLIKYVKKNFLHFYKGGSLSQFDCPLPPGDAPAIYLSILIWMGRSTPHTIFHLNIKNILDLEHSTAGVTRLYHGLTYLQNNKVDFLFYQLLKDLFKYYYVEAYIFKPLCNMKETDMTCPNAAQYLHLRSRLYRFILINILQWTELI